MSITYFTNDNYRILSSFYDAMKDGQIAYITQQEVADKLQISRATVNKVIGELRDQGYVEQDGKHVGRCILTKKALKTVEKIREIER